MSLLNVVNLDIVPLQAVDCVKDWDYFSGFVIQTIVPLLSEYSLLAAIFPLSLAHCADPRSQ
jgi:hypothetical protein